MLVAPARAFFYFVPCYPPRYYLDGRRDVVLSARPPLAAAEKRPAQRLFLTL